MYIIWTHVYSHITITTIKVIDVSPPKVSLCASVGFYFFGVCVCVCVCVCVEQLEINVCREQFALLAESKSHAKRSTSYVNYRNYDVQHVSGTYYV